MSSSADVILAQSDAGASPTRKLLRVDGDRLVLAPLTRGLEATGIVVETAEPMTEAEDLLASATRPDLAIVNAHPRPAKAQLLHVGVL